MSLIQDQISNYTKQRVLNYERSLIDSPLISLPYPLEDTMAKYTVFQINQKVIQLIKNQPHNLHWIGNGKNSLVETYIYCLLMISASDNKSFVMFKSVFYQLCKKYLDLNHQKLIVQFFCLLEISSDKYLFLKKYPVVQNILLTVFNQILKDKKIQINPSSQNNFDPYLSFNKNSRKQIIQNQICKCEDSHKISKITEIYHQFTKIFDFIQFKKVNQSSFELKNQNDQKMYVIVEKQYFFALQVLDENEVFIKKSKLTKGDLNQVERLLKVNKKQSENKLQQTELNKFRHQVNNLNENKKKTSFRNDFKPYFQTSKSPQKKQKNLNSQSFKQKNQRQKQYIDLMESSFQESKSQDKQNQLQKHKKNQQLNAFKFYKPKTFLKNINTPSFLYFKKKDSNQKNQNVFFDKRVRSPSQLNTNYFTMINNEEKYKQTFNTNFRLNSPPKVVDSPVQQKRKSPHKNCLKKEETLKQKFDLFSKYQSDRQNIKKIIKKNNDLVEIQGKNENEHNGEKTGQFLQKKVSFFPSYSPKAFNNRTSLQSKHDIDIFCKIKKEKLNLVGIPEAERNEELSRRDFIEKKKIIRYELCQSLNGRSQSELKSKLFEKFQSKYGEGKMIDKRNKSLEDKETQPSQEAIPLLIRVEDKQCPERNNEWYDGYEIRIIGADSLETWVVD